MAKNTTSIAIQKTKMTIKMTSYNNYDDNARFSKSCFNIMVEKNSLTIFFFFSLAYDVFSVFLLQQKKKMLCLLAHLYPNNKNLKDA